MRGDMHPFVTDPKAYIYTVCCRHTAVQCWMNLSVRLLALSCDPPSPLFRQTSEQCAHRTSWVCIH